MLKKLKDPDSYLEAGNICQQAELLINQNLFSILLRLRQLDF